MSDSTPQTKGQEVNAPVFEDLAPSLDENMPPVDSLPRDATEEEIKTLPHVIDRIPFAAWAVIFAGAAERFTYYGVIAPWQNYMQNPRGNHAVPGALGLGQATAVNISNAFFLFSFLTPILFAVLSDMWLGRYKTLILGLTLYICGSIILVTTSLPVALDNGAGLGGLIVSMIFIALGVGSIKAAFSPFLGDQYIQRKPQLVQRKNGNLVVVDGTRTLQFIFNAYFWFTNVASLSSFPVTILEKKYDFWQSYVFAVSAICVAIVLLLIWAGKLVKISPQGNILPQAARTVICASKSGFKLDHAKPSYQQTHYGRTVPWSDHFVDEMKRGFIACRVIFSFLIFYLCINQMYNNLVSQAGQMNLHGVPNDMIQAFSGVACIIFGPIIQAMYGVLAKHKIPFGPIARITAGFIFCGAGMAYAAGLQKLIYSTGPCYDRPFACPASENGRIPNNVNVWIQMPVYVFLAIGEIFGFVTAYEYAYSKAPRDMKTVVQSLTQLTACVASLLGMAISPAAKDPNMVILYSCLAGAMGLSSVLFYWKFRKYDKIDYELNKLDLESSLASSGSSRSGMPDPEKPESETRKPNNG
ncbi:peptide transporter ptr2 [Ophidiomyces ophidiicola]|nr:peptide transporter ptr2 [Ophidiomyces ophidiicola]KAI1923910.1 peptide transporter ptr2 [Ophidiomyces ophidiicola]KAI2014318.1 peptide transporter ptr2 [Ophidiomyces ophidiicola]KAI2077253.1 peptide transporter ptr2 [Ophidiomyces ophidiicola]KAI2139582.1 peptide transporter ptr2 [Ophidiomyces ophidiicola]